LQQQQFSDEQLVNPNFVNWFENCFSSPVFELVGDFHDSVIAVKVKRYVILWVYFKVIAATERVAHLIFTVFVQDLNLLYTFLH